MNELTRGKAVLIKVDGQEEMIGILDRIVKVKVPFGPESNNPNDWTYHVNVSTTSARDSGTYQVGHDSIKPYTYKGVNHETK